MYFKFLFIFLNLIKGIAKKLGAPLDPPGLPAGVVPDAGAYQSGLADWEYVYFFAFFFLYIKNLHPLFYFVYLKIVFYFHFE